MQGEKENISAFVSECYDKYHTAIYKFCLVRLGEMNEHADDCVQEVFLVFQNKLLEGIEILNPRAYLYKIADNIGKDTIKKSAKHRRRNVPLESAEHTESPPLIPDGFDYDKCAELIVSLLSDEEQTVYRMKYVDNLTITDIAQKFGISPAAAAKRISRLRKKITDLIKEQKLFGNEVTL